MASNVQGRVESEGFCGEAANKGEAMTSEEGDRGRRLDVLVLDGGVGMRMRM
jgi:hypothetical protein